MIKPAERTCSARTVQRSATTPPTSFREGYHCTHGQYRFCPRTPKWRSLGVGRSDLQVDVRPNTEGTQAAVCLPTIGIIEREHVIDQKIFLDSANAVP